MERQNIKYGIVLFVILCWLGWHVSFPINLIASDLGRYINNGHLLLHGYWDVLYKNFYSYTNPEYPFINYHWLFGVFCYVIWHYAGFTGLSIVYLLLELLTFYLFFSCWRRFASFPLLCAFALLSFPLIAMRTSIRPEGISYFFCGLFWMLIDLFRQGRLKPAYLIAGSCILQVIWVNTHIFFVMGPVLIALFWWQARQEGENEQASVLQKLFFCSLGSCLINPFGINIFAVIFEGWHKVFSFPILESEPLLYFLKLKPVPDVCLYFLATLGLLIAPLFFLIQREGYKKYASIGILFLALSLAVMKAWRMIGLYGYCWLPISAYVYTKWLSNAGVKFKRNMEMVLVAAGILVSSSINFDWKQNHSLGVAPGTNDAAEFFKREKIAGPIFNNFNIGGYLIFHLSPSNKLFIDDRGVAAFPQDFLKNVYVPMELREEAWAEMDKKYQFNVIFYSPEGSFWKDRFIWRRFSDPSWALVFFSEKAVIFLKRNEQNALIIRRFEKHVKTISPTEIDIQP
jgi:hypothetical protein